MALSKVDSTGTKVRVSSDNGVKYEQMGCLQSIGSLEETRASTSYGCLSSNDSTKSLGGIERSALDLQVLLDTATATNKGQELLKKAFYDNKPVKIQVELSDTGTTSGTVYEFAGQVSKYSVTVEKDSAVMVDFSVEIVSAITEAAAK